MMREAILGLIVLGMLGTFLGLQRSYASREIELRMVTPQVETIEQVAAAEGAAGRESPGVITPGGYFYELTRDGATVTVILALLDDGRLTVSARVRSDWYDKTFTGNGAWKQDGAVLSLDVRNGAVGIINGRYVLASASDGGFHLADGRSVMAYAPTSAYVSPEQRQAEADLLARQRAERLRASPWLELSGRDRIEMFEAWAPGLLIVLLVITVIPLVASTFRERGR